MLDPRSNIPKIEMKNVPEQESDDILLLNGALSDIEKYA
jgi:hypothetical protein